MSELVLIPFSADPTSAVQSLHAAVRRTPQTLHLSYRLSGELARLRIPAPAPPDRVDELWKHTCFEVFLAPANGNEYLEFNVAPSGAWAAYSFTAYRTGMAPLELSRAPAIHVQRESTRLSVDVELAVDRPASRAALTAVVEDVHGKLSYWALSHPVDRPDFHHAAGFTLDLDLP